MPHGCYPDAPKAPDWCYVLIALKLHFFGVAGLLAGLDEAGLLIVEETALLLVG